MMRVVLAAVVLALGPAAHAQCTDSYSRVEMGVHLGQVDDSLRAANVAAAKVKMNEIGNLLPCMTDIADGGLLARFGRHMARSAFFEQDEDAAVRWGLFARFSDADLEWDLQFDHDHPFRRLVEDADEPPIGAIEDQALAIPTLGGVFLNGNLILEPVARAEVPQLVQLFDANGSFIRAYWQDGAAFPADMLEKKKKNPPEPPRWYVGDVPTLLYQEEKTESNFPVVPVAVGGSLLATSGLTYALAGLTAASMSDKQTPEELTTARSTANALAVASGVTFAGAIGIGVGGVLIDGRTVGFSVRF